MEIFSGETLRVEHPLYPLTPNFPPAATKNIRSLAVCARSCNLNPKSSEIYSPHPPKVFVAFDISRGSLGDDMASSSFEQRAHGRVWSKVNSTSGRPGGLDS